MPARTLPADDPAAVAEAAAVIRGGGLVAFGTETVYGLGAHALDPAAVAKVFAAKGRPRFDPLIVHLPAAGRLGEVVTDVPAVARTLAAWFWPGPLTLTLPKRACVPDLVTAGLPDVAVRVPASAAALRFLEACGVPVCAPSANPFGGISPTTAAHVRDGLGDAVDLILDAGPCRVGVESTVLAVPPTGPPALLRPGGVTRAELEAVVGPLADPPPADDDAPQIGPGRLSRHYAPRTPLTVSADPVSGPDAGLLAFVPPPEPHRWGAVETLSAAGDPVEAAANFYAALRRLDAAGCARLAASPFPPAGLGEALNDRLRRAAAS